MQMIEATCWRGRLGDRNVSGTPRRWSTRERPLRAQAVSKPKDFEPLRDSATPDSQNDPACVMFPPLRIDFPLIGGLATPPSSTGASFHTAWAESGLPGRLDATC